MVEDSTANIVVSRNTENLDISLDINLDLFYKCCSSFLDL